MHVQTVYTRNSSNKTHHIHTKLLLSGILHYIKDKLTAIATVLAISGSDLRCPKEAAKRESAVVRSSSIARG